MGENIWVKSFWAKSVWVKKYMDEEKYMGEKSEGKKWLVKSLWVKSLGVKGIWLNSLWVKSIWVRSIWVKGCGWKACGRKVYGPGESLWVKSLSMVEQSFNAYSLIHILRRPFQAMPFPLTPFYSSLSQSIVYWQTLLLILATIVVPHRSPNTDRTCF